MPTPAVGAQQVLVLDSYHFAVTITGVCRITLFAPFSMLRLYVRPFQCVSTCKARASSPNVVLSHDRWSLVSLCNLSAASFPFDIANSLRFGVSKSADSRC